MSVLFVLCGSALFYRFLGLAGVETFSDWVRSARMGLVTMFVFTGISHFAPMRKDLIAMVPPALPRPDLLVVLTGVLELAGAVGLLFTRTRVWAAYGLLTLLVLMLPANISAARRGILLRD